MTTIDDLDPVLVVHLLSFLPVVQEQLALVATATARCRLVCRQWANVAKDDALWQDICDRTFGLTTRSAPPTLAAPVPAASPTYWDAAKAWLRLHEQLSLGSHFPRMLAPAWTTAVETWHSVEQWTQEHTPAIRRTLAPPAPAASWPHVRSALGFLPDAPGLLQLRVLVALHDGQGLRRDDTLAREADALPPNASADWSPSAGEDSAAASEEDHVDEPCLGVLGGYSAYDTVCNCRLFPLRLVVAWTRYFRRMCSALPAMRTLVVVGGDWDLQKLVLLDGSTGELWLGQPRGAARTMRLHRALPPARRGGGDELLCWLGELASQMRGGVVRCDEIVPMQPTTRGICLFPRRGPRFSRAVTRGVEVTASACFALEEDAYVYSIRLRLLPPGEEGHMPEAQRGFETAQLRARHWAIADRAGAVEHVRGEGVVGRHPLLRAGGWREDRCDERGRVRPGPERRGTFSYQSMTDSSGSSFEGEIILVPGSITRPTGPEFAVTVARFPLSTDGIVF